MPIVVYPPLSTPINAADIADGSVNDTEFQYINSLTSNAQTQLNATASAASPALTGKPTITGNPVPQALLVASVNAKSATTVTIGTTQSGASFYPTLFAAIVTAADTVTVPPQISVGTNSTAFTNILANTTFTGITAAGIYFPVPMILATSVGASTAVTAKFNVNATATTLTLSLILFGFYL